MSVLRVFGLAVALLIGAVPSGSCVGLLLNPAQSCCRAHAEPAKKCCGAGGCSHENDSRSSDSPLCMFAPDDFAPVESQPFVALDLAVEAVAPEFRASVDGTASDANPCGGHAPPRTRGPAYLVYHAILV